MKCQPFTLPIQTTQGDHGAGLRLDARLAWRLGQQLRREYLAALPFPHLVLDDFLPQAVLQQALVNFPAPAHPSNGGASIHFVGQNRRQILPSQANSQAQALFHFMNSPPLLSFLEGLSGIEGLISDPYFDDGGYQETSHGGQLGIHADPRIHEKLHLQKRLCLQIFLNPEWDEHWGGRLELWDRSLLQRAVSIFPILNRCVIFNTGADSLHGHPDPLRAPGDTKRRAMMLNYYSASLKIYAEVPNHGVMPHTRPSDKRLEQRQARQVRVDQYLLDWLPPKLVRLVFRLRNKLAAGASDKTDRVKIP